MELVKQTGTQPQDPTNGVCRFEALPPEMRNKIYSYILISSNPIKMTSHRNKRRRLDGYQYTVRGTTTSDKGRKKIMPVSCVLNTSILPVSKQLRDEASSILFGCNSFTFGNYGAVKEFSRMARGNKRLMTDVDIVDLYRRELRPLFIHLRVMTRPARIMVPICALSLDGFEEIVEAIEVFVQQSHTHVRGENSCSSTYLAIDLDVDEQVKRFNTINFEVGPYIWQESVNGTRKTIEDSEERNTKFKETVLDLWRKELERKKRNATASL